MSLEDSIESLAKTLYRPQDQRLVGELVDFEVLFGCEGNGCTSCNHLERLQDVRFPCSLLNREMTNGAMGVADIPTRKKVLYAG